ncbi:MAG: DUF721 domain-containing protein [Bacteroidetes bacterium]|nr:MAG: DUF721 domain-containing protein [Bacteroidota bacterium]
MKQRPYLSVGEAIQAFLKKHGLEDDMLIQQIITDWENLMGRPIAQHTESIRFSRGTLLLTISSPVWKHELNLARNKIKTLINERVGRELVREVRIL